MCFGSNGPSLDRLPLAVMWSIIWATRVHLGSVALITTLEMLSGSATEQPLGHMDSTGSLSAGPRIQPGWSLTTLRPKAWKASQGVGTTERNGSLCGLSYHTIL